MSDRYYRGDAAQKVVEYERKRQPPVEQSPQSGMTISIVTMDRTIGPLLLGVDFGHIGVRIGDVYDGKRKLPTYKAEVNTGMSGVVPAWKVIDILNHPRLVEDRKREELAVKNELEKEDHRKGSFVLDSARIGDSSLPEFTQQEFEDALRKVTRRVEPSEPDEGKK